MVWWDQDPVADQPEPAQSPKGGWWEGDPVAEPERLPQQAAHEGNWWNADPTVEQHEARIRQRAIPTTQWGGDEPQQPKEPESEGQLMTAGRELAHGLAPMAAGAFTGARIGAPAGAAIGTAIAPGIGTAIGGLIGGGIGAIGGGYAASTAQESSLKAMGFDDSQQRAVNAKTNPLSSLAGEAGSAAIAFSPRAVPLLTRAGSALITGGVEAGTQLAQGEFDPTRLATQTAVGGVLAKPRGWLEAGARPIPHGTPGAEAAAGTAEIKPPPPSGDQPVNTDAYAKAPQVFEGETPPTAAQASGPRVTPDRTGSGAGAGHTRRADRAPGDRGRGSGTSRARAAAAGDGGADPIRPWLDREFPRVPQPPVVEGEAPAAVARGPEPRSLR